MSAPAKEVVVTFVWKHARPKDTKIAAKVMVATYHTAKKADPQATIVLIRSLIHDTTSLNGKITQDKPHVTICSKNPEQAKALTHKAAHGYTKGEKDFEVTSVVPKETKPDSTKDAKGKEIWPKGLQTEHLDQEQLDALFKAAA